MKELNRQTDIQVFIEGNGNLSVHQDIQDDFYIANSWVTKILVVQEPMSNAEH